LILLSSSINANDILGPSEINQGLSNPSMDFLGTDALEEKVKPLD
jgi:hypothetical protein